MLTVGKLGGEIGVKSGKSTIMKIKGGPFQCALPSQFIGKSTVATANVFPTIHIMPWNLEL
jgi:hypothetical protein